MNSGIPIVFSSHTAMSHFQNVFPNCKNEMNVLSFCSLVDSSYKSLNTETLFKQYDIDQPYFIVSNQFWAHKNHQIILDAALILKTKGCEFKIIFTGKEFDHRSIGYTAKLKKFVTDHDLEKHISFLGFIPRAEQLKLMEGSLAIIQPSLFEGWSTVVEDAKSLNHFIILSDIPIHREQIHLNVSFFDPGNALILSDIMSEIKLPVKTVEIKMEEKIIEFATKCIKIFN